MRTTLTLDDDVAVRLERLRRDGHTLKDAVNDALRAGLDALERGTTTPLGRYTEPVDSELLVPNVDDVWGVLDAVDGPARP